MSASPPMGSIVHVHGTGVREPEYTRACWLIEQQLKDHLPGWQVVRCSWGERHGVRFPDQVKSIPGYLENRAIDDADEEEALWYLLYEDPLFELRLSQTEGGRQRPVKAADIPPPDEIEAGEALLEGLQSFVPSDQLLTELQRNSLEPAWEAAFNSLIGSKEFKNLVTRGDDSEAHRTAIGRAIVAEMTRVLADGREAQFDGRLRDRLVATFVGVTGGDERGARESVLRRLKGIAQNLAVKRYVDRRRGALTDEATPAAGDILFYQTRGANIRREIYEAVTSAPAPVVLLTHSLGGIASLDLLVLLELPVRALITAGSQAPYLYEIDCLRSLRYGEPLPAHVPRWLNIYDRRDILAYAAEGVFPGTEPKPNEPPRVVDRSVDNRLPFPQAHSAYWSNPEVWAAVRDFLDG